MDTVGSGAWLRGILGQWGGWTRQHLGLTLLLSAGAFVFGWFWNTYIMAVDLAGFAVEPGQPTIATAPGQTGNALFWLIFFSLLAGLITYGWQRGWRRMAGDLAAIPRSLAAAVSDRPGAAVAVLLWGASVTLIISTLISSAVSLAVGLVLLALSATPLGVILNFALIRLWKGLCGLLSPEARHATVIPLAAFMTMIGEATGLLLDWLLNSWIIGLVLGVVCAAVSVLLSRTAWRPSATATLLILGVSVTIAVLRARGAWADDGGWQECMTSSGEPCSEAGIGGVLAWFGSEGSGTIMANATVGGASSGVGAAIGAGLGGAAAGLASAAAGLQSPQSTTQSRVDAAGSQPTAAGSQPSAAGTPSGTVGADPATAAAVQGGQPADPTAYLGSDVTSSLGHPVTEATLTTAATDPTIAATDPTIATTDPTIATTDPTFATLDSTGADAGSSMDDTVRISVDQPPAAMDETVTLQMSGLSDPAIPSQSPSPSIEDYLPDAAKRAREDGHDQPPPAA